MVKLVSTDTMEIVCCLLRCFISDLLRFWKVFILQVCFLPLYCPDQTYPPPQHPFTFSVAPWVYIYLFICVEVQHPGG